MKNDSDRITVTFTLTKRSRFNAWVDRVRSSRVGMMIAFAYYALLIGLAIAWAVASGVHDVAMGIQMFVVAIAWAVYPALMTLRAIFASTAERKKDIERTAERWSMPATCAVFIIAGAGYLFDPSSDLARQVSGCIAMTLGLIAAVKAFKRWRDAQTMLSLDAKIAIGAAQLGVIKSENETDVAYWRRIIIAATDKVEAGEQIIVKDVTVSRVAPLS